MIKLLNNSYLLLDAFIKTKKAIGGLVLKTLNSRPTWLIGLHMADWMEGRCHEC